MPFGDSEGAHEALLTYGDEELEALCTTYFPELDAEQVADEFLAVKLHVRTTKDVFMFPINDKDPTAGKCMRISGEGSVMERLFTQPYIGSKSIPN